MWTDWEAGRGTAVKGKGYGKTVGEGTQWGKGIMSHTYEDAKIKPIILVHWCLLLIVSLTEHRSYGKRVSITTDYSEYSFGDFLDIVSPLLVAPFPGFGSWSV